MRTIAAVLVLFSGMFVLHACKQDTKSTEKQLDSLALMAWEAEAEITGIETGRWRNLCEDARENVAFINYNYTDTMSRETALAIDKYMRAAKTLEGFVGDFEYLTTEVGFAAEQVNKLKEDFTKQARPLDSINAYIVRETKNLDVLNKALQAKTGFARMQAETIEQYAPEINAVIEELKIDEQNND